MEQPLFNHQTTCLSHHQYIYIDMKESLLEQLLQIEQQIRVMMRRPDLVNRIDVQYKTKIITTILDQIEELLENIAQMEKYKENLYLKKGSKETENYLASKAGKTFEESTCNGYMMRLLGLTGQRLRNEFEKEYDNVIK